MTPRSPSRPTPALHTEKENLPEQRPPDRVKALRGFLPISPATCGFHPGALWNATPLYLPASSPLSECTEAIRHLSTSCRNKATPLRNVGADSRNRLAPPGEDWGVRKRCFCRVPSGPGSHCDRRPWLRPEHFCVSHLTADLHDKHTSIFGTPRRWVLSARAQTRA